VGGEPLAHAAQVAALALEQRQLRVQANRLRATRIRLLAQDNQPFRE